MNGGFPAGVPMRGFLPTLVAAAVACSLPSAYACHATATLSGSIAVGDPLSGFVGGVTEIAAPCDPASPLNGVDGVWFDLAGFGVHKFRLTMDDNLDADTWFYTTTCGFIGSAGGAANGFGAPESGTVPANAGFVVVDGFLGTGNFELALTDPAAGCT